MRKTTTATSWQRTMLHAWLGFMLLLAFYLLSFGMPHGSKASSPDQPPLEKGQEAPPEDLVLSGAERQ